MYIHGMYCIHSISTIFEGYVLQVPSYSQQGACVFYSFCKAPLGTRIPKTGENLSPSYSRKALYELFKQLTSMPDILRNCRIKLHLKL